MPVDQFGQERKQVREDRPFRHDREHREPRGQDSDGPVLEVRGRIRLGNDIGQFFQLQRPLERGGVVVAAAKDHALRHVTITHCRLLDLLLCGEHLFHQRRHALQRFPAVSILVESDRQHGDRH